MSKIKPLFDRVLVKRFKNESITSGGIHVPESSQGKTQIGSVVAVGDGRVMNDGSVKAVKVSVGNKVVFGKFSGTDIEMDGQEYLVLNETDILGIME